MSEKRDKTMTIRMDEQVYEAMQQFAIRDKRKVLDFMRITIVEQVQEFFDNELSEVIV